MRGSWAAGWERERGGYPFTHLGWGALRVWGREEGGAAWAGRSEPLTEARVRLGREGPTRPQAADLTPVHLLVGPHPPSLPASSELPAPGSQPEEAGRGEAWVPPSRHLRRTSLASWGGCGPE